jgi:hypothetical protein
MGVIWTSDLNKGSPWSPANNDWVGRVVDADQQVNKVPKGFENSNVVPVWKCVSMSAKG